MILESAGCKSVLSAGWVLLWGGLPINKAHSPLRPYAAKEKKHKLVKSFSDRINGSCKVWWAKKTKQPTTSVWPWQPSSIEHCRVCCQNVDWKRKGRVRTTVSGKSLRIMQLRTSFIPQPVWLCMWGAAEHTYTHKHTADDLNFTPRWNIRSAEFFLPSVTNPHMHADVTHFSGLKSCSETVSSSAEFTFTALSCCKFLSHLKLFSISMSQAHFRVGTLLRSKGHHGKSLSNQHGVKFIKTALSKKPFDVWKYIQNATYIPDTHF